MGQQRFKHRKCWQAFHHNFKFACFGNLQLLFSLIPSKTDLMQVTGQMLFAQIVKDPLFSPFKQRVKRLGRIVMGFSTRIFFAVMIYPVMRRILFTDQLIGMQFIGSKVRTYQQIVGSMATNWQCCRLQLVPTAPVSLRSAATSTHCLVVPLPRLCTTPF